MPENDRNHIAWLNRQLPFWREKGWLTPDASEAIKAHYGDVPERDTRRMTSILLAVLAALLIGGGVILIFAYNWENLARPLRAVLSVAPLLFTYVFGFSVLNRNPDNAAMREGVAVGNLCALVAAIGLVGQTYNIPGDLTSFLTTVCLLSLPVAYLFRSNAAMTLYLAGIVWRRWEAADFYHNTAVSYPYLIFWGMLALIVPFIFMQASARCAASVRWLGFAALVAIAVALPPNDCEMWGAISAYALLCSSIIGLQSLDDDGRFLSPSAVRLSSLGLFIILLVTSFGEVWKHGVFYGHDGMGSTVMLLSLLGLVNVVVLAIAVWKRNWLVAIWTALAPLLVLIRLLSINNPEMGSMALLMNAIGFAAGAATMFFGYQRGHMGLVNFGLTVMSGIFLMRFFDSDMSMLARGCGFIVIGVAFIGVNIKMSREFKKEKAS